MKKKCSWCNENIIEEPHNSCDDCVEARSNKKTKQVIDVPLKGSKDWYKGRWFRKSDKLWKEDIKRRRSLSSDGSVVGRFKQNGERIS